MKIELKNELLKCPNCGLVQLVGTKEVELDNLGTYTVCNWCEASFDVDFKVLPEPKAVDKPVQLAIKRMENDIRIFENMIMTRRLKNNEIKALRMAITELYDKLADYNEL